MFRISRVEQTIGRSEIQAADVTERMSRCVILLRCLFWIIISASSVNSAYSLCFLFTATNSQTKEAATAARCNSFPLEVIF